MYLKSLEIQGFKSFANKITFQFHNGITGIVGPNGSGKSNVGDAVRWVLGEQSSKQLRGSSMQDVIFAGTENRKPLGYASVAITLDNADHRLPIDFEEVTVTRRVYRSGESEYLMNGSTCRLKDIHELFYDTGIGKEGYSIVGQGQIDKILSGKPEERRELFDEAAGIVKFKRRKLAASKKLENERQNLVRIRDILSELTRQLGPLERQSEKAKQYLQYREQLRQYDVNLFLTDMARMKEQLLESEQKLEIAEHQLAETRDRHEKVRLDYSRTEREIEMLSAVLEDRREQAGQNRLLQEQLQGQIELLKEQKNTAYANEKQMRERIADIGKELEERSGQWKKEQDTLAKLQERLSVTQETEEDARAESDAAQATLSYLEGKIEEGKNAIIELLNQRASVKGKLQRYDVMLEQRQIRKADVNRRILKLSSENSAYTEELEEKKQVFEEISAQIEKLLEESGICEKQVYAIQDVLADQNKKAEQIQESYHREASRLESLINLTERYDGYGNSIRKVMEQKGREGGICGVVADLIQVDRQYETAIETALGGSIQNIVTEDEDTAKRMIAFLKKNRFGRATFLPLDAVDGKEIRRNEAVLKEPGILGWASELVHAEKKYCKVITHLLGRTLVADHIDHAVTIAGKYRHSLRIVTLEGESLSPGGSMTGGAFKNSSNLLGRRREMDELKKHTAFLKAESVRLQKEIDENRRKRNDIRQTIVELNEKLQAGYLRQNTARMELKSLKERRQEAQGEYGKLKAETKEIDSQILQMEQEKQNIVQLLSQSEQDELQRQQEISTWQKEQEEERSALEEQNARTEKLRLELANVKQREEFIKQNLERLEREQKLLGTEKAQACTKADEWASEAEKKESHMESLYKELQDAANAQKQYAEQMELFQKQMDGRRSSQKQFFAQREELSEQISALDKEAFRLNARKEKLLEQRDSQINYIWEEYALTPSEAEEQGAEECGSYEMLKKQIADLKAEMKSLGNVNVNAIEDFKELSERHVFLSGQHEDLIKAEEALKQIISELDKGMRTQFEENFAKIKIEFDKAFRELFGGGKGTLELVEGEDILEAGIRISAQPPGKKLQNMMQLSGGEKALTAIALLFAIQHLKPSPFCLLDEIEAALDESNVTRYAGYLHKLTKNTQFIIITHRRGTMAAADRLYGITMQEKGISALVSVNLIEEELDQ